ncbi:AIPR family protein [Aureimonas psammosilenae]|uniref:AIPR family protein n=1 Tax=Aureimonas psammosilenae TaxID=2495496 RepID=UPI00126130D2|nr:AIPR family protein [Aureimonas psammosilenae]
MKSNELTYNSLQRILSPFVAKGRSESAAFLNWFLENIYRLDEVEADDAICDASNDKGIDAIYVDHNNEEIHLFQCKIRQKDNGTIGDVDLKNLSSSVKQFDTSDKVKNVLAGNAHSDLKKNLESKNIADLVDKGFKLVGVYVTNENHDLASREYLKGDISLRVYDRIEIADNYVELDRKGGITGFFEFDVSYVEPMVFDVDGSISTFVFPAQALQLVKLEGISDGTLFTQNVRFSLGNTSVNKSITKSVRNKGEHKNFSLFHNGIIMLCEKAKLDGKKLRVENYSVVNGAQSLSTFYRNKGALTGDLRVLARVVSLNDQAMARKITENSNNQNSIKPRDLRSNHDLMTRLQAEFNNNQKGYFFEIKRGEAVPPERTSISNDLAGRMLMAFDLRKPYVCHQVYSIFDEGYAEIFGRKEVDSQRIIFLYNIYSLIGEAVSRIENMPFAHYGLTKFFLMYTVGRILRKIPKTLPIVQSPAGMAQSGSEVLFLDCLKDLVATIIIDLNYEVKSKGIAFDYKADMKSPRQTEEWADRLIQSYEKDAARGKAQNFEDLPSFKSI